uniref:Solute carrier family 24 member 3 n=1 Tax=Scleropages formosus TaxID=113540 RepID=A0A8C9SMP0_SCLFO
MAVLALFWSSLSSLCVSGGELIPDSACVCVSSTALHEFPRDLFSPQERTRGALLLHVLCAVYMFYALALKISEWLHLSEDVAGATFMAAGSSAPELFTSIIGVFITKGDVGVGTIVGSAVFNILCIIGICGIFAGQVVMYCWFKGVRGGISFCRLESLVLILMYLLYILIMKFNTHVQSYFERRNKGTCSVNLLNGTTSTADVDDAATVLLSKGTNPCYKPLRAASVPWFLTPASVLMVDELLSMQPHQLSFSEASMRVMITSHFSPRTRISMASRMLISEVRANVTVKVPGRRSLDSGLPGMERGLKGRCGWDADEDGRGLETGTNTENKDYKNDEEEEEDEEDKGLFVPFHVPARSCDKLQWLLSWPLCLLLFLTVPNCTSPRWQRCFVLTFLTSTLWIAAFSYVMVWMVTIIGFTLGIPDVIMGITFLAAGTSVPDCMASLTVVRQGLGDMAVSNSIGSNVFDILMGLGLPWTIKTLVIDYGSYIHINSKGLIFSVELLLASVFLAVLGVHLNKWKLDRRLGLGCLLLYSVFLCFSILIEFNMFTFINKPTCHNL